MRRAWIGLVLAALVAASALVGPALVPHDPIRPDYRLRYAAPSSEH